MPFFYLKSEKNEKISEEFFCFLFFLVAHMFLKTNSTVRKNGIFDSLWGGIQRCVFAWGKERKCRILRLSISSRRWSMAERLGKMARKIPSWIRNPDGNHYFSSELQEKSPNREPVTVLDPEGDGNCLPRALSNAVYGTEDYHKLLKMQCVISIFFCLRARHGITNFTKNWQNYEGIRCG